jgi:hypothetical protein
MTHDARKLIIEKIEEVKEEKIEIEVDDIEHLETEIDAYSTDSDIITEP